MKYRLQCKGPQEGHEFEVPDDATEEEIADAAAQCFLENSSFGWEPVKSRLEGQ